MKKILLTVICGLISVLSYGQGSAAETENIYEIGLMHYQNLNYAKAVENFTDAASAGHVKAIFSLACCYRDGKGVAQDNATALDLFTKAAEAGNASAQDELGNAYAWKRLGITKKDYDSAIKWYSLAAQQGNADALFQLGRCYEAGRGVKKDKKTAAQYYLQARAAGNIVCVPYLEKILKKHPEYAY